jgi:hypothetical protein
MTREEYMARHHARVAVASAFCERVAGFAHAAVVDAAALANAAEEARRVLRAIPRPTRADREEVATAERALLHAHAAAVSWTLTLYGWLDIAEDAARDYADAKSER